MPVPASSLSVAVQGIADYLDSHFGEDVVISVAHPQRASEQAKGLNSNAHCLNLFAYRVAPSGFHAAAGAGDTHFIRINTLITPFPSDSETEADDSDLRILGHVIRALQSEPILPIGTNPPLPGGALPTPPTPTEYRLEAVMQAPAMEELNHIWTTQGGDLAYRLSAAYEFSLIPIEPLERRVVADPPTTLILDAAPNAAEERFGFQPISENTRAIPLSGADGSVPPPAAWAPVQMLVDGETLTNTRAIGAGATDVQIAFTGPPGGEAAFEVIWTLGDETESAQAPEIIAVGSSLLDAPEARATLALTVPAGAASAVIRARPASGGAPVAEAAFGNALTLTVTGGA